MHFFIGVISREAQLVKTVKKKKNPIQNRSEREPPPLAAFRWIDTSITHVTLFAHHNWLVSFPKYKEGSPTTLGYLPSVGCRQSTVSWSCNDLERWTECSKSSWGQLGGTSSELQKPGQLFLCETGDHSPKPPHDLLQTRKGKDRSAKEVTQAHQQLTRILVNCNHKQVFY